MGCDEFMSERKIKVLVVDDSALMREMISKMLSEDPEIEVLDTAHDTNDARSKIKSLNPDIITLDIEMPGMDGISFLEKIMTLRPMPVIMCSTLTQKGAEETIKCLEIGAVDFVGKPFAQENKDSILLLKNQLISKIKIAVSARIQRSIIKPISNNSYDASIIAKLKSLDDVIIAVGASTGGVEATKSLLESMPKDSMPPILITQHMPKAFTSSFASRLSSLLSMNVKEAENNMLLEKGGVYIAPGDLHMEIKASGSRPYISLKDGPLESGHKPSVDVLMKSVAQSNIKTKIGVMLTGMGKDGAEGMLKLKQSGSYNIGQSEESCVVYGMPKAAKQIGAIDIEAPVQNIASVIIDYLVKK